jgi:hypothetical protein
MQLAEAGKHLRFTNQTFNDIKLMLCAGLGKQSSISDLIGRPQYTAFKTNAPPIDIFQVDDDSSIPGADDYLIDADYPIETYL